MGTEGALKRNEEHDQALHERFIDFVDSSGLTDAQVAPLVGTEPGDLLHYRHGGELRDLPAIEDSLRAFLDRLEDSIVSRIPGKFCLTSQFDAQFEFISFCHKERKMGVSSGPSGDGKTTTNLEFVRRFPDTMMITAHIMCRTANALLRALCDCAGSLSYQTSGYLMFQSLTEHIKRSDRFLIVDDAAFLTWECFELLRALHDQAGVGIALTGQPVIYDSMRSGARRGLLFDQILSRIAIRRESFPVKRADVKVIATSIIPGLKKDCIDFLFKRASGQGRFRTLVNLLNVAAKIASMNKTRVDLEVLLGAERFLLVQ